MRIDCFIMNPPYAVGSDGITEKIIRAIKAKKPSKLVSIQPMYRDTLYKTATWVKNPFESYNPINKNLWIFDMLGNKNDYFGDRKKCPFWCKQYTSDYVLYGSNVKNFVLIKKEDFHYSEASSSYVSNFPPDFLLWLQTNKYAQWCRKTFFVSNTKTGIISKLWEIYNERGNK